MLVLLPPSETKRPGGEGPPVSFDDLALPVLAPQRSAVADALVALAADADLAARVLKLSAARRHEIDDNAALRTSGTMPAVERYTGVLYDALSAGDLDGASREWLGRHALIHSAPFGPVGGLDGIPAYRLAAGTSVPGLGSLRAVWSTAVTTALAAERRGFVLDLRSEAYAALGPLPAAAPSVYVRVVSEGPDGVARALNHFNKRAKGELVRSLATDRPDVESAEDLVAWASSAGWSMRLDAAGELQLTV